LAQTGTAFPLKENEKMNEKLISVALNQQQLELIDNTLARGVAASRIELFRKALKEYAAGHSSTSKRTDKVVSGKEENQ
jgi:metal-responsive CopG/Arc/MetJ family transcriptional regulator